MREPTGRQHGLKYGLKYTATQPMIQQCNKAAPTVTDIVVEEKWQFKAIGLSIRSQREGYQAVRM